MSDTQDDKISDAIRVLADAAAVATRTDHPRVADAAIEVLYVITSRIRPWLAASDLPVSTHAVLEYTVNGLEAQIAVNLTSFRQAKPSADFAAGMAKAETTVDKTLCLIDYAAYLGAHFTSAVEE